MRRWSRTPDTPELPWRAVEKLHRPTDAEGRRSMASAARIDLHCHSSYSDETIRGLGTIVFHPLLSPREVYERAKAAGMDFVTITDHDTIDGCKALLDECDDLPDFIVGEEVSATFPEDGTIVHVNVFDHDEAQHAEIQRRRGDIRELCAYLRTIDKLFVLNHLTWTEQHRPLTAAQLETVLDLFDVFEGLNGTFGPLHNAFTWYATYGRGKTLVAGSDSHTHRVGSCHTLTRGATRVEVLAALRSGEAQMVGKSATIEQFTEDAWLLIRHNIEARLAAARGRAERWACRGLGAVGRWAHPWVCRG